MDGFQLYLYPFVVRFVDPEFAAKFGKDLRLGDARIVVGAWIGFDGPDRATVDRFAGKQLEGKRIRNLLEEFALVLPSFFAAGEALLKLFPFLFSSSGDRGLPSRSISRE